MYSLDYGDYVTFKGEQYLVWEPEYFNNEALLLHTWLLDDLSDSSEDYLDLCTITVSKNDVERLPPRPADSETLKRLFRLDAAPWQLAAEGRYPFGRHRNEIILTEDVFITEDDVLTLIDHLYEYQDDSVIIPEWFDNFVMSIVKPFRILYPEFDSPGFSPGCLWRRVRWTVESHDPWLEDLNWLPELRDCYLRSKGKPLTETVIPEQFRGDLLSSIEEYAKEHTVDRGVRDYYEALRAELHEPDRLTDILKMKTAT